MDALGEARGGRPRPAPRLLPQSDRRRSRPRPVARGRRARRRARADPVRRPRLSGLRRRARGRRRRHAAGGRGGRAGAGRAELRQEFRLLSRPARHAVRQGVERARGARSRSAICSASPGRCGRCRPIIGAAVARIILDDPELRADWRAEVDAMGARIRTLRARLAAFDPRLAYIGGQKGMFSMLPLTPGAGAGAARRATASTWRARAGSTSSACRTTASTASPPRWWRRWMAEAPADASAKAQRPNAPDPDFDWRRDRLSRPGQPGARPARGGASSSPSARCSTSSARAATTWRRSCSAAGSTHPPRRAPAAITARGRCCSRWASTLADALGSDMGRAGGYSDGRDIGVVFNYPEPERLPGAADVRRRRRAIYADRRLGAGDRLSSRRCSATTPTTSAIAVVLGGDASVRDQRLLVGADHRHDAEAADAVLHRGQSIRHLGALDLPDAGRRHRREPGELRATCTSSPATAPSRPRRRG